MDEVGRVGIMFSKSQTASSVTFFDSGWSVPKFSSVPRGGVCKEGLQEDGVEAGPGLEKRL